jgi:hypothetical protein
MLKEVKEQENSKVIRAILNLRAKFEGDTATEITS